jgi:hypothetical protein
MSEARTWSGTAVSIGFLALAAGLVAVLLVVSPRLNADIDRRIGGGAPPDRAIIDSGEVGGQTWVAATEVADDRGCVVVELDGRTASAACTGGSEETVGEVAVAALAGDGRWFVSGVVDAEVPLVRLSLTNGQERVLVPRGGRTGFLAGYWVTLLEPDVALEEVAAVDRDERVLAALTCTGAVATADGAAAPGGCRVYSGGQG